MHGFAMAEIEQVVASNEQVLAKTRHWLETAVIGLNLCPFAKAVYVKNQVRIVVSNARHLDGWLDELDAELDLLANTPAEQIDTTLMVHAELFPVFLDFYDFLDFADTAVTEHELEGVILVASFHPLYQFDGTSPDDISNYTNRAPYPMLHLLREASVDKAVEAFPDPNVIVDANIATLRGLGLSGWKKLGL